jgi:hypothetical protein
LRVQFPPGTTLDENQHGAMAAVDQLLLEQPETEYVFTTSGGFLCSVAAPAKMPCAARSHHHPEARHQRQKPFQRPHERRVLSQFNLVGRLDIRMYPESVRGLNLNNSPVRADVDVMLQSPNTELLQEQPVPQVLAKPWSRLP